MWQAGHPNEPFPGATVGDEDVFVADDAVATNHACPLTGRPVRAP